MWAHPYLEMARFSTHGNNDINVPTNNYSITYIIIFKTIITRLKLYSW